MSDEVKLPEALSALIAAWHAANRKPLPWRRGAVPSGTAPRTEAPSGASVIRNEREAESAEAHDVYTMESAPPPYHVWLSEIMLQQTRIEAVIPYYERFLSELPDVASLAAVDDDRLLKLWQGLGYYSRARNLKKAAAEIMRVYGGEIPPTVKQLRSLPGIGDYTAGAIASIAFGEPEPAVDGNVLRVLARICADGADVMLPATRKAVTERLRRVYPTGRRAGLFTEGLMELGETVCLPNGEPKCAVCPVREICLTAESGRWEDYPVRSAKKERRVEELTVLLLCAGERYAVSRRPETGLLAGMWEFPHLDGTRDERETAAALAELGFDVNGLRSCGTAKHIFTHVEWHMTGFLAEASEENDRYVWKTAAEIERDCAVPTAFRHWMTIIQKR